MSKGRWNLKKVSDLAYEIQIKKSATPQQIEYLCRWLRVMISEYQSLEETFGSAETGGEKAGWISVDERMPEDDDTSVWVCFENGSHYCSARWSDDQWWGYNLEAEDTFHIEQKITQWRPLDFLPTFRRTSQNQTVSGGVERAHEGITADKSELLPTQLEPGSSVTLRSESGAEMYERSRNTPSIKLPTQLPKEKDRK